MLKDKVENLLKKEGKSEVNNSLFEYINVENNDMFSKMTGIELQELICHLNHYYLSLRDYLSLDMDATFGVEIECENLKCSPTKMKNEIEHTSYECKNDGTLHDGIEIVSPILTDSVDTWEKLQDTCSVISKYASIGSRSGGHVHVGAHVLGDKKESWLNFIKLWSVYENIIFRFCYGEFLTARSSIYEYANNVSSTLWKVYKRRKKTNASLKTLVDDLSKTRYQAVNFSNVEDFNNADFGNTIEFRCPNGTLDPVIWQNNINLLVNLLSYSKSTSFNNDIVLKRKNIKQKIYGDSVLYRDIYLEQALELCDMLFNNNLDKLYFLRQYLKSFEKSNKEMKKAKVFTKTENQKNIG